jgi:hypothetical protein
MVRGVDIGDPAECPGMVEELMCSHTGFAVPALDPGLGVITRVSD